MDKTSCVGLVGSTRLSTVDPKVMASCINGWRSVFSVLVFCGISDPQTHPSLFVSDSNKTVLVTTVSSVLTFT